MYSLERELIADTIKDFVGLVDCYEKDVLLTALDTYKNNHLDFVDCVLYAYNKVKNIEIITFDKRLNKLLEER